MIKAFALVERFRVYLAENYGYIWGTSGTLWTEARQKALEKTTDPERANSRKYGSKWIGHMVVDCSGAFAKAFRELGGTMYHGSDTMYRKWCSDHGELQAGRRTDNKTLKPGTAVFCWNGEKYSHVGLYVGGGIVIEAMGAQQGVTTSKISATKWKYWGELNGVDYKEAKDDPGAGSESGSSGSGSPGTAGSPGTPSGTSSISLPTLRRGSKGEAVIRLQTRLKELGYNLGSAGIDGDFGQATMAAVKRFQRDRGLIDDGIVGPKTWAQLETALVSGARYTVTIPGLSETEADALVARYPNAHKSIAE